MVGATTEDFSRRHAAQRTLSQYSLWSSRILLAFDRSGAIQQPSWIKSLGRRQGRIRITRTASSRLARRSQLAPGDHSRHDVHDASIVINQRRLRARIGNSRISRLELDWTVDPMIAGTGVDEDLAFDRHDLCCVCRCHRGCQRDDGDYRSPQDFHRRTQSTNLWETSPTAQTPSYQNRLARPCGSAQARERDHTIAWRSRDAPSAHRVGIPCCTHRGNATRKLSLSCGLSNSSECIP